MGALGNPKEKRWSTRLGFEVFRPVVDGARYDFIFDDGDRLIRVQCKSAPRRRDIIFVSARTSRRAPEGFRRTVYTPAEVDVIAAYCAELDRCFAVPIVELPPGGAMHLRLAPTRNGQRAGLHFADDYPLGAIAQLEEHLAGSEGVVGSSPTSSTTPVGDPPPTVICAHEFRTRFSWCMERAAAGEPILITRRGKPHLRIAPAAPQLGLVA